MITYGPSLVAHESCRFRSLNDAARVPRKPSARTVASWSADSLPAADLAAPAPAITATPTVTSMLSVSSAYVARSRAVQRPADSTRSAAASAAFAQLSSRAVPTPQAVSARWLRGLRGGEGHWGQ